MNSLSKDLVLIISEFCFYEDIRSLCILNKFFNTTLKKYRLYKSIKYNRNSRFDHIVFNEQNKHIFQQINRNARCPICGALFKSLWRLVNHHLAIFPSHNISRDILKICIGDSLRKLYFKIPSVKEYSCLYGVCECPSKTRKFIDKLDDDSMIDMKFTTEFGHFYIYNVQKLGLPQHLGILKFYDFHMDMRHTFRILFFRQHYWLQLYTEHADIISIYDINVRHVHKNNQCTRYMVLEACILLFFLILVGGLYIMIIYAKDTR